MTDNRERIVPNNELPLLRGLKHWQWWVLVVLNVFFLIAGQAAAVLLGNYYYDQGGNSKWMATLVQTAAFPVLLPFLFLSKFTKDSGASDSSPRPTFITLAAVYCGIGILTAGDNMLYSIGLLYLATSTYSLICATQLAFNAILSYFINSQKFTALISNSVVILSLSAALLAINDDSDAPGASKLKYIIGIMTTLAASALYSLILSLMQLSFEKIIKKQTFSVVLEMQIYSSIVASCVSTIGLFASGEWRTLLGEMDSFQSGSVSYVMSLVWTAVAWQVCAVGVVGLIFLVSSLFSNVISTVSLAVTPIVSVIIFHDNFNGVKLIAMLFSIWGCGNYFYQNCLDDLKAKSREPDADAGLDNAC